MDKYGEVAGFKLNKTKTKILTKNVTEEQKKELEETLGLKVVRKVKYLGIWITARCSSLKEDNYTPLLQKIYQDLDRWKKLKLSLLGKIAAIKMNILPKIIFLFQNIPVNLDKKFFLELNKNVRKFLWEGKKARFTLKILQGKRTMGGFGLPDWETYYKAAKLVWVKEWVTLRNKRILSLEGHDLQKGWHAFLWDPGNKKKTHFHNHKIRESLIYTWEEVRQQHYVKIPKWLSIMEALTLASRRETEKFGTYEDIIDGNGNLKALDILLALGYKLDWWNYAQINSRFKKDKDQYGIEAKYRNLDKIMMGPEKKMLAKLYNLLLDEGKAEEIAKNQLHIWEKNIGYELNFNEWEEAWNRNYKILKAVTYRENHYKILHRWYLAPARVAKMFPNISPICWKCGKEVGTFFHMWWTCPHAKRFWFKVRNWLREMIDEELDLSPESFLLGILKDGLSKEKTQLVIHITTAARLVYAKHWKDKSPPPEEEIINKILECAEMAKLTYEINNDENSRHQAIWNKWYKWLHDRINSRT